ncbi:MAG: molybdopterin cofactor-binding domain-containing protein [Pseudomonadales bacterium]
MSLPGAIQRTPELGRWLFFNENGTVTVRTGKVEIGQGIRTALAMIAAEELYISLHRVVVQTADTELTPNEFVTAGSMSVEDSGSAIRVAAATAREYLLALAGQVLGVDPATLLVEDGTVSSTETNEQTDYWSLQGGHPFELTITAAPALKDPHDYTLIGTRQHRLDVPDKVKGNVAFLHDMTLPRMRYGRIVKPPVSGARLTAAPETLDLPGVDVVRNGSFLGVVADREETTVLAAERLARAATWDAEPLEPLPEDVPDYLREHVTVSLPVREGAPQEEPLPPIEPPPGSAQSLTATYYRPFQMHAALGPSAAIARYLNGVLTVYSHSQGVELLKLALADALALQPDQVHVIHAEGAGCYGHNGADDVALDAALLAVAIEPDPVRVQWSRADEHGFEPYGPAALVDMAASLDAEGRILEWRHETYSFTHMGRPRPQPGFNNLQSSWWLAEPRKPAPTRPALFPEVGIHRNMTPIYALPNQRLVKHFVAGSPLRTSSLRSLGAFANVFAIESFMDELAHAAGKDPFEFRLTHLEDPRAIEVLKALRREAPRTPDHPGCGRGIAMARYKNRQTWCAVLVDLHVTDDARVHLDDVLITADAGLVIDPDGVANQLEGGFIQAASWTLKEAVRWDAEGVTSRDWESYPILTFSEIPQIRTHLVRRPLERALGVGEASTGPTPAAIANAIFAATSLRIRELPITAERLRAAAAG